MLKKKEEWKPSDISGIENKEWYQIKSELEWEGDSLKHNTMDPFVPVTSLRAAFPPLPPPTGDNGSEGTFFLWGVEGRGYCHSLTSQVYKDSLWPKIPELSENLTKSISQGETGRTISAIS